jgi:hypothetical protein
MQQDYEHYAKSVGKKNETVIWIHFVGLQHEKDRGNGSQKAAKVDTFIPLLAEIL